MTYRGNGDGTFTEAEFPTLPCVFYDINLDGMMDCVTESVAYLGARDGSRRPVPHPADFRLGTGLLADLDGDDVLDFMGGGAAIVVQRGLGNGAYAPAVVASPDCQCRIATFADVNGDGAADIVGIGNDTIVVLVRPRVTPQPLARAALSTPMPQPAPRAATLASAAPPVASQLTPAAVMPRPLPPRR